MRLSQTLLKFYNIWMGLPSLQTTFEITSPNSQVFSSRISHLRAMQIHCFETKLSNLKLKTQLKLLLGYLPLDITLPILSFKDILMTVKKVLWCLPSLLLTSHGLEDFYPRINGQKAAWKKQSQWNSEMSVANSIIRVRTNHKGGKLSNLFVVDTFSSKNH